jgi:phosphopantetheinyl transferase (holo-ACP synthase)
MRSSVELATPLTLAFTRHETSAVRTLASSDCGTRAASRDVARSRDRLAGFAAARLAVARASGIPDEGQIVLRARRDMPPAVFLAGARGALQELPIALSVTHSAGRAVAAAACHSLRIGVDLERCGSVRRDQLRYFLALAERRGDDHHSPTALWVLKEAAWKALGCNGTLPFNSVALRFDSRGSVNAVSRDGQTISVRAALLRPWPGFVCAVIVAEKRR